MGYANKQQIMIKKQKIQSIVNAFETGSAEGNYGSIDLFFDGPNKVKQLTAGRSGATQYGNLPELFKRYVQANGQYAQQISRCLKWSVSNPNWTSDKEFHDFIRKAGNDPIMREVQDKLFDDKYWNPAMKWAETNGFKENLSLLVIYDSFIHSGSILSLLRKRFSAIVPASGGEEKLWITQYLDARHQWLKYHSNLILRKTIYRTIDMKRAISANDWNLDLPFSANDCKVA